MKKFNICLFLAAVLLLWSCTPVLESKVPTADNQATAETVNLLLNMKALTAKGFMFGHQDDLAYGIGWEAPEGPSDIYLLVNDYPAIFGWDLGHIELGAEQNLDGVSFASMKQWAIQVHAMGGINTYSWHADNPLTGGSTWDISSSDVVRSVLPFGEKHDLYLIWLDRLAAFFLDLKDESGLPIPVIFRPYHEHTGNWFWWGQVHCTSEEFRELWHMTFHYLKDTRKVNNLLWAYSPSDNFKSLEEFTERYPGKDYVDIVGFDMYQQPGQTSEHFAARLKDTASLLVDFAVTLDKLPAITEMGYEQVPDPVWWTTVVWASFKDLPVSYALFWRNAINRPDHYYAPYPGHLSQDDFIRFYELPETLFLSDIEPENVYDSHSF
ncbi:MAG: glycoside hydrolase family 26 protein [Bacteroidales bacterium]|nr:glycoside hydrolase family 26 protein [Bacteroidales bacterium]